MRCASPLSAESCALAFPHVWGALKVSSTEPFSDQSHLDRHDSSSIA